MLAVKLFVQKTQFWPWLPFWSATAKIAIFRSDFPIETLSSNSNDVTIANAGFDYSCNCYRLR